MSENEEELARRQRALDERERAFLEREESLARTPPPETSIPESGGSRDYLDRRPPLVAESSRRSLALLLVFLAALVLLGWMLLRGGKPTRDAYAESVPFEVRRTAGLNPDSLTPPVPSTSTAEAPPQGATDQASARAIQQQQELLLARQRAPILIAQGAGGTHPTQPTSAPLPPELPNAYNTIALDAARLADATRPGETAVDPNTRFQDRLSKNSTAVSVATRTRDRDYLVLQGKFVDAVSETAMNSDLPGQVRAVVSYDIYAESGRRVMLPRGTRLIGEYNTAIAKGQGRLFVVWTRAIRPDGVDIALLSSGSDSLGRSGLAGEVDNHFWTIFGTSALLSIIGAGAATAGVNTSQDQLNSASIYRSEIAESFNRSASRVLEKYLDIKPTITIANGELLKIFVARDLDFSSALADTGPRDRVSIVR